MTHIQDQITDDRRRALDGFSQLVDMFFDVPQMPMPQRLSHCVIAEDDEIGITTITRLAAICEQNEVPYYYTINEHDCSIGISYNGVTYQIFYVYRNQMRRYNAEMSYQDNLRSAYIDPEDEC